MPETLVPVEVEASFSADVALQTFAAGKQRIGMGICKRRAKRKGLQSFGAGWLDLVLALLSGLLPDLLNNCKKDSKTFYAATRKASFLQRLGMRTNIVSWLRNEAEVSAWEAVEIAGDVMEFGQGGDFTQEDADEYFAGG